MLNVDMSMMLEGLKVVDAASYLAAPAAATVMSAYGADVIKIEPLQGDGYILLNGVYSNDYYRTGTQVFLIVLMEYSSSGFQ